MRRPALTALLLAASACSQPQETGGAPRAPASAAAPATTAPPYASYEAARTAALAAMARAAEAGNVWTTSDDLLKRSQQAAQEGKDGEAMTLADEARVQAELAISQAETEKASWRRRVLASEGDAARRKE